MKKLIALLLVAASFGVQAQPRIFTNPTNQPVAGTPIVGCLANQVLYADASANLGCDADLTFDASTNRLTVGSGSGTSSGWEFGNVSSGSSGFVATRSGALSSTNYNIVEGTNQLQINHGNSILLNIGNVTRFSVLGTAGAGPTITAGTAASAVSLLSGTQTRNYSAAATDYVSLAFTTTATHASDNYLNILDDAASMFRVGLGGAVVAAGNFVGLGTGHYVNNAANTESLAALLTSGVAVASGKTIGFSSGATDVTPLDVILARDAANTHAWRNGTNAQKSNLYARYTSATDYARAGVQWAVTTLAAVSGASVTATNLIPAKARMTGGVISKVTVALGATGGTTGYAVGTAGDPNLWGDVVGTATTVSSAQADATADPVLTWSASAQDVIVTAAGGNFDGTGSIYLAVPYIMSEAD